MDKLQAALQEGNLGAVSEGLHSVPIAEVLSWRGEDGGSLLHSVVLAANKNASFEAVARFLIECGADPFHKNGSGISAIQLATPQLAGFLKACWAMRVVLQGGDPWEEDSAQGFVGSEELSSDQSARRPALRHHGSSLQRQFLASAALPHTALLAEDPCTNSRPSG
eukprot:RCo011279